MAWRRGWRRPHVRAPVDVNRPTDRTPPGGHNEDGSRQCGRDAGRIDSAAADCRREPWWSRRSWRGNRRDTGRRVADAHVAPRLAVDPNHSSGIAAVTGAVGQVVARGGLAVPSTTRTLPVRVVCDQLTSPDRRLGRRHVVGPLCLATGEPGLDPDLMSRPADRVLIINTHVTLAARVDGSWDITGPYVDGPRGTPTLTLRWGTRTRTSHFLLFTGAQLRLPRLTALPAPRGPVTAPVLSLLLAMTDAQGELLRGVIAADDLAWQLTSRQYPDPSAATRDSIREAVIASTA